MKPGYIMRISSCWGKTTFNTFTEANTVARRKINTDRPRGAYHCPVCRKYHIGRKPKVVLTRRPVEDIDMEST